MKVFRHLSSQNNMLAQQSKDNLNNISVFMIILLFFFWVINSLTGITEKKIIQHEFIAIIQSTVVYIISEVISYVPPLVS